MATLAPAGRYWNYTTQRQQKLSFSIDRNSEVTCILTMYFFVSLKFEGKHISLVFLEQFEFSHF